MTLAHPPANPTPSQQPMDQPAADPAHPPAPPEPGARADGGAPADDGTPDHGGRTGHGGASSGEGTPDDGTPDDDGGTGYGAPTADHGPRPRQAALPARHTPARPRAQANRPPADRAHADRAQAEQAHPDRAQTNQALVNRAQTNQALVNRAQANRAQADRAGRRRALGRRHGSGAGRGTGGGGAGAERLPAWPLAGLLLLYPLWWALGLGVLIFPLLAVPMAGLLVRAHNAGRSVRVPPGFGLWLVFLATLVVGLATLGADPAGTLPGGAGGRLVGAVFRLSQYGALTVLLLYAGNLSEAELPRRRLVRLLGWLFVVTVAGGLLGVFAGRFEFTSPVELVLPAGIRNDSFVQSLVHPYAAQIMDLVGGASPRPAAPWGYTNTWGNNFCLLVVWFFAAVWGGATRQRTRVLALACLAVSVLPVVHSLNRGLWIGLGVIATYVAVRLAMHGRPWAVGTLLAATGLLAAALAITPLGDVVGKRLDNGKSNGVRMYLTERAVAGVWDSPVIGFGSTRTTLGGRNSITVGESPDCERCGNFTVGGNGQLWQLLFAHGLAGTAAYLGFFGYGLWRFRRDRTALGLAGSAAIVGSFAAMFWYNALVTPLAFLFLAYALLWRHHAWLWRHDESRGAGS
ncbi:MAG TPA: hypothetical protein VES42_21700 [Pilimelia sp.]|nr:hypothetical protein [Pilimelia sp.]